LISSSFFSSSSSLLLPHPRTAAIKLRFPLRPSIIFTAIHALLLFYMWSGLATLKKRKLLAINFIIKATGSDDLPLPPIIVTVVFLKE
jgi:hypothetical protein